MNEIEENKDVYLRSQGVWEWKKAQRKNKLAKYKDNCFKSEGT